MVVSESLKVHFDNLALPPEAQDWLLALYDSLQALDDWYDGDFVDQRQKELQIYNILVILPSNPFYQRFVTYLTPLVSNLVLKWVGANALEYNKEEFEKAFMWRAAFYDVVLEVVRITHGAEKAMLVADYVAKMYGEKYEDYKKEF
tara:strand:- start:292 stop:729 length:438 start_codon:yes stop_codon:yes gene_type:complete